MENLKLVTKQTNLAGRVERVHIAQVDRLLQAKGLDQQVFRPTQLGRTRRRQLDRKGHGGIGIIRLEFDDIAPLEERIAFEATLEHLFVRIRPGADGQFGNVQGRRRRPLPHAAYSETRCADGLDDSLKAMVPRCHPRGRAAVQQLTNPLENV